MTHLFVPYEQALELKELGFNETCFGWFRSTLIPSNFTEFFLETEFGMNESPSDWVNSNLLDKACSAPLYQQAFSFLLKRISESSVAISITYFDDESGNLKYSGHVVPFYDFDNRNECLSILIEIAKKQKEYESNIIV